MASTPGQRSVAARQIVDELRHQYLIAFESSGKPGWHPLVVRARDKDLIGSSPEWIYRGAISPEFAVGGSIMFRKFLMAVPIAVLAIGGSTACATKKFVRTSVGEVNDKVDSLGRRSRKRRSARARTKGGSARSIRRPQAAGAVGAGGQRRGRRGEQRQARRTRSATKANAKVDAIDKASKRLVYEVVLSEDQGNFKFGKTKLPDEAKAKLDEMVAQMKQDPKNVYLEIEGHTDNVGAKAINEKIGLERAEAVKRYLYEQYQIPLHKMNVISYGEEQAGCAEQDQGRPRAESPRRDQGPRVDVSPATPWRASSDGSPSSLWSLAGSSTG